MKLLFFLLSASAGALAQVPSDAPFKNPDLTPERRADELVSSMTLEEKVLKKQNSAPA